MRYRGQSNDTFWFLSAILLLGVCLTSCKSITPPGNNPYLSLREATFLGSAGGFVVTGYLTQGKSQETFLFDARSDRTTALQIPGYGVLQPAGSPDGKLLAYTEYDFTGEYAVYQISIFDLTTMTGRRITDGRRFYSRPVRSGNGEFLYYTTTNSRHQSTIVQHDLQTSRTVEYGPFTVANNLTSSFDGKQLSFLSLVLPSFTLDEQDLVVLDTDSGTSKILRRLKGEVAASISKDGNSVYTLEGTSFDRKGQSGLYLQNVDSQNTMFLLPINSWVAQTLFADSNWDQLIFLNPGKGFFTINLLTMHLEEVIVPRPPVER